MVISYAIYIGIAYILAVLASLAVALTLTPALAFILLTGASLQQDEPRLTRKLKTHYARLLTHVEHRSTPIIIVAGLLCLAALATLPFISESFIPELKEGHYTVHMAVVPGTSLQESMRVGQHVTAALQKIDGVRLVA